VSPERLRVYKLVLSAAFLAAAVCFVLPFLVVSIDERLGRGNGIELASGDAPISGRYVHQSYEGHVEDGINLAELPAGVAFTAVLAGAVGAWLPSRKGFWLGLGAGVIGLLSLLWMRQALTGQTLLANVEWRYGYWLSLVVVLTAAAAASVFLYRTSWTYVNR
jgi:hypothetical protein